MKKLPVVANQNLMSLVFLVKNKKKILCAFQNTEQAKFCNGQINDKHYNEAYKRTNMSFYCLQINTKIELN